jgi:hypothetical protein
MSKWKKTGSLLAPRGTIYGTRINIGSVLYQADLGVERQHKN